MLMDKINVAKCFRVNPPLWQDEKRENFFNLTCMNTEKINLHFRPVYDQFGPLHAYPGSLFNGFLVEI